MDTNEISTATSIGIKDSCCESYKRTISRCFNCPEAPEHQDPDQDLY